MSAAQAIELPFVTIGSSHDDDWHERRRLGLGASEIAIVMGASGWNSVLALHYEKTGEVEPEERETREMLQWGNLLESTILEETARRAEVAVAWKQPHLRSTEHPWALATPDGLTPEREPIEVKNMSWGFDAEEWAEQIPEKYYLQCQQHCLVTGAGRCLFGALTFGCRLLWEWVPRDETTIKQIIKAGSEFWRGVETRTPPVSDGHPAARRALAKLATDDESVELFESEVDPLLVEWETAQERYSKLSAEHAKAKKVRDAAADALAQKLGKARSGFTTGGWSFRWKTTERKGYTVAPATIQQFEIKPPKGVR